MKQLFAFIVMLLSASFLNAQDMITLSTGEIINGKVAEVGTTEVRYYRADNIDGPVYVTSKAEVAQIVYANGTKDVFQSQTAQPIVRTIVYDRRTGRGFYRPYVYPIITPHIDLGHHGIFGGHHGGYYGGHH
ncbi:MAG: hypothetical protein EKK39_05890 [Sphingobacteriales bacterium]|uniref:hypothetical protein n=2 Tax=Hydrotalea TaxID=1004300 RepID=UPI0009420D93|nr:hypothetical protein [Hydrotalea flava]RTL53353.1 MAG: hypothetical protein EKK39_05890 [Sphingobacteriales bacterium]